MFDYFSIIIFVVLIFALTCAVRVFFDTLAVKKAGHENVTDLQANYELEKNKSKIIIEKLQLLDELQVSLIDRLFKITRELFLIQKLIFKKPI